MKLKDTQLFSNGLKEFLSFISSKQQLLSEQIEDNEYLKLFEIALLNTKTNQIPFISAANMSRQGIQMLGRKANTIQQQLEMLKSQFNEKSEE